MVKRAVSVSSERWRLAEPFVTSHQAYLFSDFVVVELREGSCVGRGEASGVEYKGETPQSLLDDIERVRSLLEAGLSRDELQRVLPAGGARNAIDCALWALEADIKGIRAARIAGVRPTKFQTVKTLSLNTPEKMADQARRAREFGILKLKLDASEPTPCASAVKAARPDARLIADINGGWTLSELRLFSRELAAIGVEMIEQPLAAGEDSEITRSDSPIPLCADESCSTREDLVRLPDGYSMICIKLDKAGGLTEALALANAARAQGLRLMVSNMIGTSLGMAPASLIAGLCDYVDLDGPLLLETDRVPGIMYQGDQAALFERDVWA
jgi:L-alanine-DL-glutamate epimerase-like enolase superfamily enzyme